MGVIPLGPIIKTLKNRSKHTIKSWFFSGWDFLTMEHDLVGCVVEGKYALVKKTLFWK